MNPKVASVIEIGDNSYTIHKTDLSPTTIVEIDGVKFTSQELAGVNAKHNRIKCSICGDVIESIYSYHRVYCTCGNCSIDGGSRELIRDCNVPYVELSKFYSKT